MFFKTDVLKNFAIFTGTVLESLFNKVAGNLPLLKGGSNSAVFL